MKFILTGDSKSAVRAFTDTAAASETSGAKIAASGRRTTGALAATEKGARKTHGAISSFMGTTGLIGAVFGLQDVVRAGVSWSDQQAQLQLALGKSSDRIGEVNKALDESSTHGGFAAPEEQQGFTQFLRLTHSVTRAMQLNAEAVDFARGAHLDYGSAVRLVSQVQTGNVGRLQRYLGIIIPAKKSTQDLTNAYNDQTAAIRQAYKGNKQLQQAALDQAKADYQAALTKAQTQNKTATAAAANAALLKKYGGAAEAYSKTTAGQISNANNSFHLLAVTLGRDLNPTIGTLARLLSANPTLVLGVTGALAGSFAVIKGYELAVRGAAVAQGLFNLAQRAFIRQAPAVEAATTAETVQNLERDAAQGGGILGLGRLFRGGLLAKLGKGAGAVGISSLIAEALHVPNADAFSFLNPQSTSTGAGPVGGGDMIHHPGMHYDPRANHGRGGLVPDTLRKRVVGSVKPRQASTPTAHGSAYTGPDTVAVHNEIKLEGRTIAEVVHHYNLRQQARK